MIVNLEIDTDALVESIIENIDDDWKTDVCERIVENIDASDIAEHVSAYEIAHQLDMDDVFANVEMDYEELSELVIHAHNFKNEVAALMWQQFSDEFGASMKCVREEIAALQKELDERPVACWKRWFKVGDKKKTNLA